MAEAKKVKEEVPVKEEEYKGTKIIHLFPEDEGDEYVYCGVDGVGYQVKVDEDVEVPYNVWECLTNAKKDREEAKKRAKAAEKAATERAKSI